MEVAIVSLSDTASTGMDNISSKMLKLSRKTISGVLAEIFNNSITMSSFPAQWKQAVAIPIFKKGDVTDVNNYRPISLLPVLSKVFEKIIAAQFCQHIENSCILSPSQFGFRLGRSTESALLRLSKLLFTARQNGRFTSLTTIDFSKAFDCICHSRLLNKLSHYKISHESILFFKSYLLDRSQRVRYGGVLSEPMNISHGVPEGSVLGPHLFNLYINSVFESLPTESVVAYADDITIVTHGDTAAEANNNMQNLLLVIDDWAANNLMAINTSKCFNMLISPYIRKRYDSIADDSRVTLGSVTLTSVTSMRILGVDFCNNLSWVAHSNKVRQKMNCMIGVLKRCGRTTSTSVRLQIYNAFIAPHLDYCLPVWGHLPKTSADAVEHCLVRMLRYILRNPSAEFTHSTCKEMGLRTFQHAVTMRCSDRILDGIQQGTLDNILFIDNHAKPISSPNTRTENANKLVVTIPKRRADDYSFQTAAPAIWNKLPNNITRLCNKRALINSVDEFYSLLF